MSVDARTESASNSNRYEAVLRISEAISACREPEKLATTLAEKSARFCTSTTFTSWC